MEHRFLRTEMVLGDRALEKLSRCHVAVFGLGGVGSYAAEILARSGVGELTPGGSGHLEPHQHQPPDVRPVLHRGGV